MERTFNLQTLSRNQVIAFFVLLFHAVGLAGFLNPQWQDLFLSLVPFHLLLMFMLLLLSHQQRNLAFFGFLFITYLAGFGIEYFGVHTGLIFGSYQYGETLGAKLADIPLLIGLNWVLLIYSSGVAVNYLPIRQKWLKVVFSATLLVLLDWLIEPVAIRFDYWSWANQIIPLKNYISWFLFSLAGCWFFYEMKFKKNNPVGLVLLLAQFLFFIALNLWA